jgi:hypothetical protein
MIKDSLLTDEEINQVELSFIEDARIKHRELGMRFIHGELTYPDYEKESSILWVGYYKFIAKAQHLKTLKAVVEWLEENKYYQVIEIMGELKNLLKG